MAVARPLSEGRHGDGVRTQLHLRRERHASTCPSKGLGLTYGVGWTVRHTNRLGVQVFGAQHVVALGDFQTGGTTIENVVGNYWSVGAALVIR